MRRPILPVLQGSQCDRRQMLLRLGLGGLLAAGCRMSLEDPIEPGVELTDAGVETDANPSVVECDGNLCLDLQHPANEVLTRIGGYRLVTHGTRRLIVVRVDAAAFVALSAACTHAGTSVVYRESEMLLVCPNHGSRFTLEGDVARGPAAAPLAAFEAMFDAAANQLTIVS